MMAGRKSAHNLRKRMQRGSTAVVVGTLAPILIFGMAFGTEAGTWLVAKRRAQHAADIAAFAAGKQIAAGNDIEVTRRSAAFFATQSGFTGDENGFVMEYPPANAPVILDPDNPGAQIDVNGNSEYVYITLEQTARRYFSTLFAPKENGKPTDVTISTQAVARILTVGGVACVVSLDPNANNAIRVSGNTDVGLNGCQLALNSSSSQSFVQQGSSSVSAECLQTVGGVSIGSQNAVSFQCGGARTRANPVADPYADVPDPADPLVCVDSDTMDSAPVVSGRRQIVAGCYEGDYTFHDSYEFLANATSNVIYLRDGTFRMNAGASVIGDGIVVYVDDTASLDINGSAEFRVTAATSGDYAGVALFFSRDFSGRTRLNGGSDFSVQGAVYAPSADLEFSGNTAGADPTTCTQIIGRRVEFTGNSAFAADCEGTGVRQVDTTSGRSTISVVG